MTNTMKLGLLLSAGAVAAAVAVAVLRSPRRPQPTGPNCQYYSRADLPWEGGGEALQIAEGPKSGTDQVIDDWKMGRLPHQGSGPNSLWRFCDGEPGGIPVAQATFS